MLESRTTSHMTPHVNLVTDTMVRSTEVILDDESSVAGDGKGVRTVRWKTENGLRTVRLSTTLHIPKMAIILLSVSALVKKNIGVIIFPKRTILIDLEDDHASIEYALHDTDELFYISGDQRESCNYFPKR